MSKVTMTDKIIANLQACNGNLTAADIAIIRDCLEAFCDGIIEEINQNANITMAAGDFGVLPGTFLDSTSSPVTGEGENKSFDLTGKIS